MVDELEEETFVAKEAFLAELEKFLLDPRIPESWKSFIVGNRQDPEEQNR